METPPNLPGYGSPNRSNYPKIVQFGQEPLPPGPPNVRLSAVKEAWELLSLDLGVWTVAALVLIVIVSAASFLLSAGLKALVYGSLSSAPIYEPTTRWVALNVVGGALMSAFMMPLLGGMHWMCLKRIRAEKIAVRDVFYGLKHFARLAAVGLFGGLLTILGLLLFVLPGVYMLGIISFAPLIAMDHRCSGQEAVRLSYMALRPHGFAMGVLQLVLALFVVASSVVCLVPVLFTVPVYFCVIALHYHAFFPPQRDPKAMTVLPAAPQFSA